MKKSKQMAVCGVIAALSVVLLFLGSVVWVFAYCAPILTGLLMIILLQCMDVKSSLIVYVAVSMITLIFMPDKECPLTYIFFFGYYSILKPKLEKIKLKFLSIVLKLVIFNIGIIASQLILIYAFGIPFDNVFGKWGVIVLILLANVVFFVYDKLLNVLIVLFNKKYKNKIMKFIK